MSRFLFILVQAVLYLVFLRLDLTGDNISLSSKIKFTMIILCFCYALLFVKSPSKSFFHDKEEGYYKRAHTSSILFKGALFFTVISDLFLLILNFNFLGVLTFIIVQQLYGLYLDIIGEQEKEKRATYQIYNFLIRISIQVFLSLSIIFILHQNGMVSDKILTITIFYFLSIITNVIRAVREACRGNLHPNKNKSNILFAIGMLLFLLCDINVGLFNLADFISVSKDKYELLYSVSSILMWTFYAPSQVLITLSGKRNQHS